MLCNIQEQNLSDNNGIKLLEAINTRNIPTLKELVVSIYKLQTCLPKLLGPAISISISKYKYHDY